MKKIIFNEFLKFTFFFHRDHAGITWKQPILGNIFSQWILLSSSVELNFVILGSNTENYFHKNNCPEYFDREDLCF